MNKTMKQTILLVSFLIISVLLIGVIHVVVAGPLEEKRAELGAGAVRELLPATHRMTEVDLLGEDSTLTHLVRCYDSTGNFIGYVFTAMPTGFVGDIEMMVALSPEGVIEGLQVIEHSETRGLGADIGEEWFADLFVGRSGMLFGSHNATTPQEIDILASATVSTEAILRGVNDATAYVTGDEVPVDTVQEADTGAADFAEATEFWPEAAETERLNMEISFDGNGHVIGYVFYVTGQGHYPIHMAVAIDIEGVINGVQVLHHNETWNFGAPVLEDEDFFEQFVGRSGTFTAVRNAQGPQEIDTVSMATLTVDGVLEGINDAMELFNNLHP